IPAGIPQDALHLWGEGCPHHGADFPWKTVVATGPRHWPSVAQTRQVYCIPALMGICGDQTASFSPAAVAELFSLVPAWFSRSKTCPARGWSVSRLLRARSVTEPGATPSP